MFNDATLTRLLKIIGETTSKTKAATGVPFVVTYRPNFKVLGKFIHENLNFIYIYIYIYDDAKDTFTPGPVVSFRTARILNRYLVRAKL